MTPNTPASQPEKQDLYFKTTIGFLLELVGIVVVQIHPFFAL
ncbi:MAG: hypothetical protein AB4426_11670 [Xenococcaceae cyanobacterium]